MRPDGGMVLAVRRGHSPNCSATGSVVGLALVSAVACAAVVNAFAERFATWRRAPPPDLPPPRLRPERFGALLAWPLPAAVLLLDHDGARAAIDAGAQVVGTRDAPAQALSAPIEVHVAVTGRCPASCDGCYLDAGPDGAPPDPALDDDLRKLADAGVLEIALGGGEVLLRDDLLDLGERIRALGMVPNLTTSGFGLTETHARRMAATFGQVNVSLDGLGADYAEVRGWDGAALGLRAIRTLVAAGVRAGVNTVIARPNLRSLEAMGDALAALGVSEWQWLRFKPAGRGRQAWDRLAPGTADLLGLWPRALAIERDTGLVLRWDCAMVPFLAAHRVPVDHLRTLAVEGCPGGRSLLARGLDGRFAPCSFTSGDADDPDVAWRSSATLGRWRERAASPPEPCASCDWREVCGGGCRVVAAHLAGDELAADPQCPRVAPAA
ncbi:MAG: radical SAM protein [Alphaproteobacteria bacterium]|nr:radical SAM protein [Alphaproteobacteria bacterium]MCB9699532.1 radical SAM protein [Alphaproteobacteria bacterium]